MSKELIHSTTKKDFEITFFSGTGAGGQHRNRHMNCVRIRHPESGVIGTGQSERSLEQNKKEAFRSLINNPKFKTWHRLVVAKANLSMGERKKMEEDLEKRVEKMMDEKYLKVEYL
jgi:protein subunit release factor A